MWSILFPGQGSQTVGMGKFYYDNFNKAKTLFDIAEQTTSIPLKQLCFEGPLETLTLTQNAQVAIVLVSCCAWECLSEEVDLSCVKYIAGHSVGEYSALYSAGVLTFIETIKAVKNRSELMHIACTAHKGGMGALLGPSSKEAQAFCQWVESNSHFKPLSVANFNTLEQTVISGNAQALKWAYEHYKEYPFGVKKVRLMPLNVSGAFHSSLMTEAEQKMKLVLQGLNFKLSEKYLVVQNTTAKATHKPQQIYQNLTTQIQSPVMWVQSMQYLLEKSCTHFIELGNGKTLSGILKKINRTVNTYHFHSMEDKHRLQKATTAGFEPAT